MYQCRDCGRRFEAAERIRDEIKSGRAACPHCGGGAFSAVQSTHCRYCGARLPPGAEEYCNAHCRRRGELMWERERRRRGEQRVHPLYTTARAVETYNQAHGTRYSYGQFVTLILPRLNGGNHDE